jgi:hypothetical protein
VHHAGLMVWMDRKHFFIVFLSHNQPWWFHKLTKVVSYELLIVVSYVLTIHMDLPT